MYKDLLKLYGELHSAAYEAGYTTPLVCGEGAINPMLMLIGEAPGANEEAQRKPFVGKAGKNLNELLEEVHISREEAFVSNLVKIRPSAISDKGNVINRTPSPKEKAFFEPYLLREIALVKPKIIVTLGNTPLGVFTNSTIGSIHGRMFESKGYKIFPLYHPASIIYKRELLSVYKSDLLVLADIADKFKIL